MLRRPFGTTQPARPHLSDVQNLADQAYARLKQDPRHPSLHFKKVPGYRYSPLHRASRNAVNGRTEIPSVFRARGSRHTQR